MDGIYHVGLIHIRHPKHPGKKAYLKPFNTLLDQELSVRKELDFIMKASYLDKNARLEDQICVKVNEGYDHDTYVVHLIGHDEKTIEKKLKQKLYYVYEKLNELKEQKKFKFPDNYMIADEATLKIPSEKSFLNHVFPEEDVEKFFAAFFSGNILPNFGKDYDDLIKTFVDYSHITQGLMRRLNYPPAQIEERFRAIDSDDNDDNDNDDDDDDDDDDNGNGEQPSAQQNNETSQELQETKTEKIVRPEFTVKKTKKKLPQPFKRGSDMMEIDAMTSEEKKESGTQGKKMKTPPRNTRSNRETKP